ncbi:hypothetical protein [Herbaspirillum sp. Sphag1AN]|uniref:hypothetical protein n=1 Tax=unclassified Herbaspirillum TaxID=2624150 RepID=UPI00351C23D9
MVAMLMLALAGCDYVEKFKKFRQTPEEAKAEGVALGAGCRQVGQSLEDCYQLNPNALKAGIFTGWKDMHEYMAAKGIDTVKPPAPEPTEEEKAAAAKAAEEKAQADKEAADKAAAPVDERAARREKRERERAMKEKGGKDKDSSKS